MRKNHEKNAQPERNHLQRRRKRSRQILNVMLRLCMRKSFVWEPNQIPVVARLATTLNVTQNLATRKQCPMSPNG